MCTTSALPLIGLTSFSLYTSKDKQHCHEGQTLQIPRNYFLVQRYMCEFCLRITLLLSLCSLFKNEKCLFIISIYLHSTLVFLFKTLKRKISMHFTLTCVGDIYYTLFIFQKFVKLRTKSLMGKYDDYVLLWKFVNVIFKGCCHERHLLEIENQSMPLLLFLLRDMIRNNTVNR